MSTPSLSYVDAMAYGTEAPPLESGDQSEEDEDMDESGGNEPAWNPIGKSKASLSPQEADGSGYPLGRKKEICGYYRDCKLGQ